MNASAAPPRPLWTPTAARAADTRMAAFRQMTGKASATELHAWSVAEPDAFWSKLAEFVGFRFHDAPHASSDGAPMPATSWFPGGTFNYAEQVLEGQDARATAVFSVDDGHEVVAVTFGDLRERVSRCAGALDAMAVAKGDRVAAYLDNGVEALVVLLACAARGAIFSSAPPSMGVDATLDRFRQIEPKVLFAADGYWDAGRHRPSDLERLIAGLPGLARIVRVPTRGAHGPDSWDDVMEKASPSLRYEKLPFDHPLYVLYTSGTTGLPKCILHRGGGALLKHMSEHQLHCDVRPGDVVFYQTNTGWMMWNWLVSALASRATIVLNKSGLFHPSRDALFRLADRLGVTHFGTSASHIHSCQRINLRPRDVSPLEKLRCVMSTGSPLAPEGFEWVYSSLREDVHLASISGGTDIVGCFMMGDPTRPVFAGQIQGAALGVDLVAFDEDGKPVRGTKGELVCRRPIPSMPLGFYGDHDGERYRGAYFDRFPGVWCHGDSVELTPEDGIVVWGRSDATLKPGGVRIGTGEIYRALEGAPEVLEALAAGKREGHDVSVWLFVVLRPGIELDRELRKRISNVILKRTTPQHVPRVIAQVKELPRTHSGKLMELAAARVLNGETVTNVSAVANPTAIDAIADAVRSAT